MSTRSSQSWCFWRGSRSACLRSRLRAARAAYAFVEGRSSSTPRTRDWRRLALLAPRGGRARGRLVTAGDWLAAWMRRPTVAFAALLAAGAFGWFALEWNNPGIGSAAGFAVGLTPCRRSAADRSRRTRLPEPPAAGSRAACSRDRVRQRAAHPGHRISDRIRPGSRRLHGVPVQPAARRGLVACVRCTQPHRRLRRLQLVGRRGFLRRSTLHCSTLAAARRSGRCSCPRRSISGWPAGIRRQL